MSALRIPKTTESTPVDAMAILQALSGANNLSGALQEQGLADALRAVANGLERQLVEQQTASVAHMKLLEKMSTAPTQANRSVEVKIPAVREWKVDVHKDGAGNIESLTIKAKM